MKLIKKYFAGSSLYFNDYLNQYYNTTDTPGINTTLFFTAPNLPGYQSINNNIKSKYDFSGIAKEAGKNMYNNDNLNIAASFFLNNGYSKELTAALLANAFYESGGLNNDMMLKGDGIFFGGWQWHKNQMKAGHFSASDLVSQLNYLHEDIKRLWPQKGVKYKQGKRKGQLESHNGWNPKYKKLWDRGGTAALLSKYFSLGYERHTPNAADDARRAKLATSIYNLLVRGTFV